MKFEGTHAESAEKCSEELNVTLCRHLGVTVLAGTWGICGETFSPKNETITHTLSISDIWILTCCVSEEDMNVDHFFKLTGLASCNCLQFERVSLLDLKLEGPSKSFYFAIRSTMVPMNSQSLLSLSTSLNYARFYIGIPHRWYYEEMLYFTWVK